jgi:hypothetical protein
MADSVAGSVTPNPLSRKLNKILESDLDNDRSTLEALEVLSECLDKNTLQARRNLRSDLERRSLSLNEDFLHCVEELVEQVKGLQEEAVEMKACCDDMQSRLSAAKSRTAGLLRETTQLQGRSKLLDMKSKVVATFMEKFQLTPEQLQVLAGPPESTRHGSISHRQIDGSFFETMNRVKEIHEDCKVLLHMSKQRAGLEIMESMAMHLESAYEQLYHWVQNQCRLMTGEMLDLNANLRQGLKELHNRPILFQYCIDEYSIARRMALVQSFMDALTRERNSGRPIELHSHDPVRYCSDMLGWLHQAIATENDHISGLLMDQDSDKSVSILSMITEGSCRPLHVRIEQVIVSTSNAVVAYQLVNLLRYYSGVFQNHLSPTAPLVKTINDLTDLQSKMFFSTLNSQTAKILGESEAPLPDLTPTPKASELLNLLQSLLSSRDITVFTSDNQGHDLKLILSSCIDPFIQYCSESVASMSRLDRSIYLINCLYLVQSTISLYEFTDDKVESLDMQIGSHLESVVMEQFGYFMNNAGLAGFHGAMVHGKLSDENFESLQGCSDQLKSLIAAPDHFQLVQLRLLTSTRLRDEAMKKAVEKLCSTYAAVYEAVSQEKGDERVLIIMPYTPEQAKQLLN